MAQKRFTKKSHAVHPDQKKRYHVPMHWVSEFSIQTFGTCTYMYGDLVNKLGKYEDLGEPEELAKKLGVVIDG